MLLHQIFRELGLKSLKRKNLELRNNIVDENVT